MKAAVPPALLPKLQHRIEPKDRIGSIRIEPNQNTAKIAGDTGDL